MKQNHIYALTYIHLVGIAHHVCMENNGINFLVNNIVIERTHEYVLIIILDYYN